MAVRNLVDLIEAEAVQHQRFDRLMIGFYRLFVWMEEDVKRQAKLYPNDTLTLKHWKYNFGEQIDHAIAVYEANEDPNDIWQVKEFWNKLKNQ